MALVERDRELTRLEAHVDRARAGDGSVVMVTGEAGAGKTAFVEEFTARSAGDMRVLWGQCDPLTTPRPLGPLFDVVDDLSPDSRRTLQGAEHAYDIFDTVARDLASVPTILVIDDVHWADQGTSDFLRHILRRVRRSTTLVVITTRDEASDHADPVQYLRGDVARSSSATSIALQPLSIDAVTHMVGARALDPVALHRVSGGNAFYVTELLDHDGRELPPTIRDAILARTVGLDSASWDVLNLLACSPSAIPDRLLGVLGIGTDTLTRLGRAHLIRRSVRGIAFWHDLCRLAVADVLPPGAKTPLHQRLIAAYDAVGEQDQATITYHASRAGDTARVRSSAIAAGRNSARSGAHRQSAEFFRMALAVGADDDPAGDAELLELLAAESYLTDHLDEAIDAGERALQLRTVAGDTDAVSADHLSLAVYEWYNANRPAANHHVAQSIAVFESGSPTPPLGHGHAMAAFLALHGGSVTQARAHLEQAKRVSALTGDQSLRDRIDIVEAICDIVDGEVSGRGRLLQVLTRAPTHLDELFSSGYSNLVHFDVEQRRFVPAAEVLARSIDMTVDNDLPVCHVWQLATRSRLEFLRGRWDDALGDSASVLDGPSAPLARTWPLLVRGLTALRRGADGRDDLERAWEIGQSYGEPLRVLPVAAALVEQAWLTGLPDDRISGFARLIVDDADGLQWTRGDLAVWLSRVGDGNRAGELVPGSVAPPFARYLAGDVSSAAQAFGDAGLEFDAAVALTETGDTSSIGRGLAALDRLGAFATADRIRRNLRAAGSLAVPSRRRASTRSNAAGLTRRQTEVLALMGEGLTNAELADRLYLSEKTVGHHVSAILDRLAVTNRRDAVRRGRETGVID
ncbi:AAA family ATPase [Gordonia sp. ABSL49_1]|uniref:ATP-binding protein n=1 Tax=unclassified Gordonia (in: high G+C Gram-positive bacteria) TaxID=2657482 RepID=UPI001F1137C2|nr:AAA family ATPase [Gordonia sp. ABSL49_1]MCH5642609.1 AAA family ATPase [Gordonia sp. ABSL49_1]